MTPLSFIIIFDPQGCRDSFPRETQAAVGGQGRGAPAVAEGKRGAQEGERGAQAEDRRPHFAPPRPERRPLRRPRSSGPDPSASSPGSAARLSTTPDDPPFASVVRRGGDEPWRTESLGCDKTEARSEEYKSK